MADNYNPGREQVLQTAGPNIATEQVRTDFGTSSAAQLAHALGVAVPMAEQYQKKKDDEESAAGAAYANSMTLDELGKKVKSGEILPSQSPAYVATVQHIYGQNEMERQQRDTISKMTTGELKFDDPGSLDKYLVDQRNSALSGQSKFTVAGFDKGWDQFGKQVMAASAHQNDAAFVARGEQEASDHLLGAVAAVTSPDFSGTPQEAAGKVMNQYTMLAVTGVLATPDQRKGALGSMLSSIAETGNKSLMAEMLKQTTPDGITIASIMGGEKARAYDNQARAVDERNQHQRVDVEVRPFLDAATAGDLRGGKRKEFDAWVTKNEPWVTTGTRQSILNAQRVEEDRLGRANASAELQRAIDASKAAAQQSVFAAVSSGTFAFLPPLKVLHKDGEEHSFDSKAAATEVIPQIVQANKLNLTQEAQLWTTNNVENPQWKGIIAAGSSNLASVGWSADGKNVGQLNEQGKSALKLYSDLYQVNPAEAQKYAGSSEKQLGDILFLQQKGGMPDVSAAASLVNQIQQSGVTPADSAVKIKAVDSAVHSLTDPSLFSMSNNSLAQKVKGMFGYGGNEDLNFTQVAADVRRRSELLVLSGQVPDAAAAVEASMKYISDPSVTSRVNGTLYYNKDLPAAPKGESPGTWMEKFIAAGPAELAKQQGFGDGSTVRLESNRQGGFTGWVGGVPLQDSNGNVVRYTKQDVETYVASAAQNEMLGRAAGRNLEAFQERLQGTNFGPPGLLRNYSTHVAGIYTIDGKSVDIRDVLSKSNYERLKAEGLANGSVEDILHSTINARKKK